jgi:HSP20 family protein
MPGLIIWKNQEIDRLKRDINRLFSRLWDDFCIPTFPRPFGEEPFIDLSETEDRLIVRAEIPGLEPDNLDISISDDTLTLKGEARQENVMSEEGYSSTESEFGYFSRTIRLPCKVKIDDVKATYKDGLLSVVMPKFKPEPPREIKIKVT